MPLLRNLALGLALAGCFTATARAETPAQPAANEATDGGPVVDGGSPSDATTPVVPVLPAAAPLPAAPAPAPLPPQAVDPAPALPSTFGAAVGPPSTDVWPIEYVLRPQTLPARTWRGALNASLSLPDPSYRSASTGRGFNRSLGFGVGVTTGVTDRIEAWFSLPRIVCFGADPSGCSSTNRLNGTGFGVGWGAVRTTTFQLELSANLSIALSSPTVPVAELDATTKWLLGTSVALVFNAWVDKWIDAPAYYSSEAVGSGGLNGTLYLQATRHFLMFATASPNGPLNHLDDPRVAGSGGVSWTFDDGLELVGSGILYNILSRRPAWSQTIPGGAVGLALRAWL